MLEKHKVFYMKNFKDELHIKSELFMKIYAEILLISADKIILKHCFYAKKR